MKYFLIELKLSENANAIVFYQKTTIKTHLKESINIKNKQVNVQ